MARYVRSTFARDQKQISQYFQFGKQIRELLNMPALLLPFIDVKLTKSTIATFLREKLTMAL